MLLLIQFCALDYCQPFHSYNFVLWIIVNHFIHTILCFGLLSTISFIQCFFRSVVNHSRNFRSLTVRGSVGQPFACAQYVQGITAVKILFSLYHYFTWAYGAMSHMVLLCHLLGLRIANISTNLKISLILGVINAECDTLGSSSYAFSRVCVVCFCVMSNKQTILDRVGP